MNRRKVKFFVSNGRVLRVAGEREARRPCTPGPSSSSTPPSPSVLSATADIWEQHQGCTWVSKAEYDAYLFGAETAYLLFLRQVQRLEPLLTLEQIRSAATFQPPQSYRYLSQHMLHSLVGGHPAGQSLLTISEPDLTRENW